MLTTFVRIGLLAGTACCLAACGGGGGSTGTGVVSTPTPTPTPTPIPTGAYLTPGVSQSTNFATLGWEVDAGDKQVSDLATTGFAVSYDATTQKYSVALPSYNGAPPSEFKQVGESSEYYYGEIAGSGPAAGAISFLKPIAYQYTNIAWVDVMSTSPHSVFAFGLATPAGAVPVTGGATYSGDVQGAALSNFYYFRGGTTFNFDFGAGTLDGSMVLGLYDMTGGYRSAGTYSFIDTVFGSGSPSFSGGMRDTSSGLTGSFLGMFTGPGAQELMARWEADFVNPDTGSVEAAVGAMIARKTGL